MSRRIRIKSKILIEVDIARAVIDEMHHKGHHDLHYDEQDNKFINEQYDDVDDDTIEKATESYKLKLQEHNAVKIEKLSKEKGYITSRKIQDGKIKIIAKKRIYA